MDKTPVVQFDRRLVIIVERKGEINGRASSQPAINQHHWSRQGGWSVATIKRSRVSTFPIAEIEFFDKQQASWISTIHGDRRSSSTGWSNEW